MQSSTLHIQESIDAIVVNGTEIPRMKKGRLNIYNSKQINAVGGIESFLDLIGSDKPIEIPQFDFSEKELLEMDELMREENL
jgi:hypothetical protein